MAQNSITPAEKSEAMTLGGTMKLIETTAQRYTTEMLGIPNISDAVYYTQQEADAYNAELTGALDSTTPLTAEQAAAYNAAITGATKEAGDTLFAAEAAAYNATLDGAVTTQDAKIPAVPKKVKDYVDDGLAGKVDKTTKVNDHALSGDVTITKEDIGLGNVVNTSDSATPVSGGTTKFTTGGAYTELAKKADKTEVYTKTEIDAMQPPIYDATNKRLTFPSTRAFSYDSTNKRIIISQ